MVRDVDQFQNILAPLLDLRLGAAAPLVQVPQRPCGGPGTKPVVKEARGFVKELHHGDEVLVAVHRERVVQVRLEPVLIAGQVPDPVGLLHPPRVQVPALVVGRMIAVVLVDGALSSQGEEVVQERLEVPLVVGLGGPASREGRAVCHVPSPMAVLAHREEGPHMVPRAP